MVSKQGSAAPLVFAVMPRRLALGLSNICGGDWCENVAEVRVFHHDILQGVADSQFMKFILAQTYAKSRGFLRESGDLTK